MLKGVVTVRVDTRGGARGGAGKFGGSPQKEDRQYGKVDEFALLMRMVRHERVQFLREIHYKQIFSITQKDMITGDSILHLAVFEGRTDFVKNLVSGDETS